jgi:hypothetical protein
MDADDVSLPNRLTLEVDFMEKHPGIGLLGGAAVKYRIHPNQLSLTKRKQQTLCKLAAQASALSRRIAYMDPLNAVSEITPAVLAAMGVTEAMQQAHISAEHLCWIGFMSKAGEHRVALRSSAEALWSDRNRDARLHIANLHFAAAKFNWQKKRFFRGFLAASNAMIFHPGHCKTLYTGYEAAASLQFLGKVDPAAKKRLMGEDLQEFHRYRGLLYMIMYRDLKVGYKQSIMGLLWASDAGPDRPH